MGINWSLSLGTSRFTHSCEKEMTRFSHFGDSDVMHPLEAGTSACCQGTADSSHPAGDLRACTGEHGRPCSLPTHGDSLCLRWVTGVAEDPTHSSLCPAPWEGYGPASDFPGSAKSGKWAGETGGQSAQKKDPVNRVGRLIEVD